MSRTNIHPLHLRIAELLQENEALQERVRYLEEQLTISERVPRELRLQRVQERMLLMFARRGSVAKEQLAMCCHSEDVSTDSVKYRVYELRQKVRGLGIEINTRYGGGYEMPPASRAIVHGFVEQWKKSIVTAAEIAS